MKKFLCSFFAFACLFGFAAPALAQFGPSSVIIESIEPRFIHSRAAGGTSVTVNVTVVSSRDWNGNSHWTATISRTNAFDGDDALWLNLSEASTQNLVPYTGARTQIPAIPDTRQGQTATTQRSVTFNIPANWTHADVFYLHITAGYNTGLNPPWNGTVNGLQNRRTASREIRIRDNISTIKNVARIGHILSGTELIIVKPNPTLDVIATPPANNSTTGGTHIFNTRQLTVNLRANDPSGNNVTANSTIRYSIHLPNEDMTREPSEIYDEQIVLGAHLFDISDRVILRAFARNDGFDDSPVRSWTYIRQLPKARIEIENYDVGALPKFENGDALLFDTRVFGTGASALSPPVPQNGNIKLKIVGEDGAQIPLGGGVQIRYSTTSPNINCNTATLYDHAAGIAINGSLTLYAIVCSENHEAEPFAQQFVQQLSGAQVDLVLLPQNRSANHPTQEYGLLQRFQIVFDADDGKYTLFYHIDTQARDSAWLRANGTQSTTSPTLDEVGDPTPALDTFFVSVYVADGDGEPTHRVWRFVQARLPDLIFTPQGRPDAHKFTASQTVNIAMPTGFNTDDYLNFAIHYTTDGSDVVFGNAPSSSARIFTTAARRDTTLRATTQIIAAAFADDRLPGLAQEHNYRLVAQGTNAYFFDMTGDGAIDRLAFETTIPVNYPPLRVQLVGPWAEERMQDGRRVFDTLTVEQGEDFMIFLAGEQKIEVAARRNFWPFDGSTHFERAQNPMVVGSRGIVRVFGDDFCEADSSIIAAGDSVAPIARDSAIYWPGRINEPLYRSTGAIERFPDTLRVTFSEDVQIINPSGDATFNFYTKAEVPYAMNLARIPAASSGTVESFEVIIDGIYTQKPVEGDSLSVAPNAVRERVGGVMRENETKRIAISVQPTPYLIIVTPISSFMRNYGLGGPDNDPPIRPKRKEAAPVVVVDFLTEFTQAEIDDMRFAARIMDNTGNLVSEISGLDGEGVHSFARVVLSGNPEKTTKIVLYWNAQNSSGRRVFAGSYLAIIVVTTPDGRTHEIRTHIGVGR